jgi:hypothetical protein
MAIISSVFDNMKFPPYEFREYPKALAVPGMAPAHPSEAVPQVIVNDPAAEDRQLAEWGFSRESYEQEVLGKKAPPPPPAPMTAEEKLAAFLAANPDVQLPASAAAPVETDPLKMPWFSLKKFTLDKTGKDPADKATALTYLRDAGLIPAA